MIPIKHGHLLINGKNMKYVFVEQGAETWDGDWKTRYPHIEKLKYIEIFNPSIWEHDVANGMPYTYGLTRDGGLFNLYADEDNSKEDIKKAVDYIRNRHDVVSLHVIRLKAV